MYNNPRNRQERDYRSTSNGRREIVEFSQLSMHEVFYLDYCHLQNSQELALLH